MRLLLPWHVSRCLDDGGRLKRTPVCRLAAGALANGAILDQVNALLDNGTYWHIRKDPLQAVELLWQLFSASESAPRASEMQAPVRGHLPKP